MSNAGASRSFEWRVVSFAVAVVFAAGCGGDQQLRPQSETGPSALAISACAGSPLEAGEPNLPGDHRSVWGGYVVGAAGEILRLDAAVPQHVPVGSDLQAVFGTGDEVYAVGDAGVVLHTSGDGQWQPLPAPADLDYAAVWASGPDIFAGGSSRADVHGGVLVHSPDGGRSWERSEVGASLHAGSRPIGIHQLWGSGAGDVYAAASWRPGLTSRSLLYHYDGRWSELPLQYQSWDPAYPASPSNALLSVWGAGGAVYLGGLGYPSLQSGGMVRLQSGVFTREKVPLADPEAYRGVDPIAAIWGPSPERMFAASGGSILFRSSSQWCIAASGTRRISSLWGPAGGSWFYAVGEAVQRFQIQ